MIPRLLHVVWIGDRPYPNGYLADWRRLHPGWEITVWGEHNLPLLRNQAIIDQLTYPAARSNLIRLELLAKYGGVYVDADCQPLRPLDTLPVPPGTMAWAMTSRHNLVQNAILAAVPGHPVFRSLVRNAAAYWQKIQGRRLAFTRVFGSHYITPRLRASATFWEPDLGARFGTRRTFLDRGEGPTDQAWIVHDCDRSWKEDLGGAYVQL